jgi:hypothetical protein
MLAVFALVVMGAMVAGIFFAGWLEQQSGQSTLFASQAAEAAEAGLSDAMAGMPVAGLEALAIGGAPLDLSPIRLVSSSASRQVSRLTATLFLIRAVGTRYDAEGGALARRTVGSLVRMAHDSAGGDTTAVALLGERGWVQLY